MFVDLPLEQLRAYCPAVDEPEDFDRFWADQVDAARARWEPPRFDRIASPVAFADVYDVTFTGHGGDPVKAWFLVPRELIDRAAVIVAFVGYNGGRGDSMDCLDWAATGRPVLVMDNRGQGGGWRAAATRDPSGSGTPSANGFLTQGVETPAAHYFTRLFVDAVCAVDAVSQHPVAAGRAVVTTGASQGGALSLVSAALNRSVRATLPDVPFLAHPRRAAAMTDASPYGEIGRYCAVYPDAVERVFATLSYLDVVNHAKRIAVPALFSVGLLDEITPASTVLAAYNHVPSPDGIEVYPFNGHEGGGRLHLHRQIRFVTELEQNGLSQTR